ncbi:MAG: hypothetical protein CMJ83_05630, partial [Planctomycetes bacterium]|nr:hypothetical protein [Planctomycetota bacterium]
DEILDVVATFRIPGGVGTLVRKFDALVSAGYLRQTTIDPYPYRLAAEDLDGDGAPEILVAHHPAGGAGGLWTYPNTGRGWLEAPTRLLSAPGVIALHAQDFNADGVPDVLAASPGGRIRHAVNGTPQGGPLRGGTGEALDLAVGIGVGSTPTSAPGLDVRAVSAGETVNLSVRSWARTYNGTIPIVALELFPTAEPPSTGMIPGVWLNPVAAQVIGIGSPLTTPGATWTHVVPAGLVGASAMLQVFAGSPVALNGAWAATDAVELRFVL